jgi:hypothetical protein
MWWPKSIITTWVHELGNPTQGRHKRQKTNESLKPLLITQRESLNGLKT